MFRVFPQLGFAMRRCRHPLTSRVTLRLARPLFQARRFRLPRPLRPTLLPLRLGLLTSLPIPNVLTLRLSEFLPVNSTVFAHDISLLNVSMATSDFVFNETVATDFDVQGFQAVPALSFVVMKEIKFVFFEKPPAKLLLGV